MPNNNFFGDGLATQPAAQSPTLGYQGKNFNEKKYGPVKIGADLNRGLGESLSKFGVPTLAQGFQSLGSMLQGDGRMPQQFMNQLLSGVDRRTEANQQAFQGRIAGSGLQNSGVNAAVGAAIDQQGADRAAGIQAQDAAQAQDRQMQQLQLLQLILGPMQGAISGGQQVKQARDANKTAMTGAIMGGLGSLGGGLLTGGLLGGGGGGGQ